MIEHIMQAVMNSRERVDLPGRRAHHLRGLAARHRRQPRGAEGLPWRLSSPSAGVEAGYGAVRALHGVSLAVRERRDRRAARHQRQRQEHADEVRHGHGAPDAGSIVLTMDEQEARPDPALDRGDRRPGRGAGARGAAPVPQAHGGGEPAARRVPPAGAARHRAKPRVLLRDLRRCSRSAAASSPARCPAASSRCWRSRAR